jgi:hypothetical protein
MLMLTPAELRHNSRVFRHSAMSENNPHLKLRLASHALALAQLAEAIERATKEPPGASPSRTAQSSLVRAREGVSERTVS